MIDARASAAAGCYHIGYAEGAITGKSFSQIVPDQDTVITVLSGKDVDGTTTVNFLTTLNLSGKTLHAGTLVCVAVGQKITDITMSSGAVMCYLKTYEG